MAKKTEDLRDSVAIKNLIQNCINNSTIKGGDCVSGGWTDELLELRNIYVISLIRDGLSRARCNQEVSETFGVTKRTADNYYRQALEYLAVENDAIKGAARKIAIERLNAIIEQAKKRGSTHSALQALDQLNKINGLYSEKKEVEITGIKFDFGGD